MAGIESNPGPGPWPCSVCKANIKVRCESSVQCSSCHCWLHFKCSSLPSLRDRRQSPLWTGPCCNHTVSSITPAQPTPAIPAPVFSLHPRAPSTPPAQTIINLLQFNCNGLTGKLLDVIRYMEQEHLKVAAIQETKFTCKSKPVNDPNYTIIRKDRSTNKGGGLAFIVHNSISYKLLNLPNIQNTDPLEWLAISLKTNNGDMNIINFYIPPTSCCPPGFSPDISGFLEVPNCIIVGDANAHHPNWFSQGPVDTRGRSLAAQIDDSDAVLLNENSPTRVTPTSSSSPDLSICSSTLVCISSWKTVNALGSDHLPITISVQEDVELVESQPGTYINFKRGDWDRFLRITEREFGGAPPVTCPYQGEHFFRKVVQHAAKLTIPCVHHKTYCPGMPPAAATLAKERDRIRASNPASEEITNLSRRIDQLTSQHRRNEWIRRVENPNTNVWNLLRNMSCPPSSPPNQPICFGTNSVSDPKIIANNFCRQFCPKPNSKTPSAQRPLLRNLRSLDLWNPNFSAEDVARAVKASNNSKALGPDLIAPIHLKKLGVHGYSYLANIFNASLSTCKIPTVWKTGKVIPIAKPGKPVSDSASYRPISLLSPAAKILESLLLPLLAPHLPLKEHQHGFCKGRSTTTALLDLYSYLTQGLNKPRPVDRSVVIGLDLKSAFDTVDHFHLLSDLLDTTISNGLKRWLTCYLRGRQQYVLFRGKQSKYRVVRQGVPQGGVLSPALFNLYMSHLPPPPTGIKLISYADDTMVMSSGPTINPVCDRLTTYLSTLHDWLVDRNLSLSTTKSTATIFTTATNEIKRPLNVSVNGQIIPSSQTPKYLGVIFDSLLSFSHHAKSLVTKLGQRNSLLRALSGTTWGKDKECLNMTYKAIGRSLFNYAAPIWSPNLSKSRWADLQRQQNSALRTITGCVKMSSLNHLYHEPSDGWFEGHHGMLVHLALGGGS